MDNGASSYRRYLEGDKNAIGEIIDEYKNGLILYLCSLVGSLNAAEETAEETFVEIAIKKPKFSEKSSFRTFLYAVGRHKASAYIKKHRHRESVPLDECCEIRDSLDIESELLRSERDIALHREMRTLKAEYRQVLYLSYFEEMSTNEIAAVMKKSRRQVENLLYNAKKSLKIRLERSGINYDEL